MVIVLEGKLGVEKSSSEVLIEQDPIKQNTLTPQQQ